MWTSHQPMWLISSFSELAIDPGGRDQISVKRPSTKVFRDQAKWEPAIDRDSRNQISVNQPSTKAVEIKLNVNHPSTETAEIKFQWDRLRPRQSRTNFSEPAINQGDWDQVKCAPAIDRDGRDQVSVNQTLIKTVEVRFQWTSHQPRLLISS